MNISYNNAYTLNLGDTQADHDAVIFANLGCPFCRKWFANNWNKMIKAVENHQLAIHLKFLNKPKKPLQNGNTANAYVDYQNPRTALNYIKAVFENQDSLDNLNNQRVPGFLSSHFNVSKSVSSRNLQKIEREAKDNGVTTVPTIFFDGVKHSDSNYNLPNM